MPNCAAGARDTTTVWPHTYLSADLVPNYMLQCRRMSVWWPQVVTCENLMNEKGRRQWQPLPYVAYTLVAGSHRESERFDAPSSRRDAVIGGTPKYPRAKNAVYLWAIMLHGRKREKVGMYTQRSDHNPVGYNHTSGERERSPTCQGPKDLGRKRSRAVTRGREGKG